VVLILSSGAGVVCRRAAADAGAGVSKRKQTWQLVRLQNAIKVGFLGFLEPYSTFSIFSLI
jgi:hypothetical protein